MKSVSIRDMVNSYCAKNPAMRPIALAVTSDAEALWITHSFPNLAKRTKKSRRLIIENHFKETKPSGIEIIIWDQDINEVFYAVLAAA